MQIKNPFKIIKNNPMYQLLIGVYCALIALLFNYNPDAPVTAWIIQMSLIGIIYLAFGKILYTFKNFRNNKILRAAEACFYIAVFSVSCWCFTMWKYRAINICAAVSILFCVLKKLSAENALKNARSLRILKTFNIFKIWSDSMEGNADENSIREKTTLVYACCYLLSWYNIYQINDIMQNFL